MQVMASQTIAVVGAMDVEIASLILAIENLQETQLRNHTFYTGTIHGQDEAKAAYHKLALKYHPDKHTPET